MSENKVYTAIGLMSGTSLDGEIDVALIRTDGHDFVDAVDFKPYPYDEAVRAKVRACFGKRGRDAAVEEAEALVTALHIAAVKASGFKADVIGFHGQTITHDPASGFTRQLGDGHRLARETGMDVVYDMRRADIAAGGQGAPLIPLYHRAVMKSAATALPVAVVNIGGVANVTYIDEHEILAFDTGPGNALMDDFCKDRTGRPYDEDGRMAHSGYSVDDRLEGLYAHPYFRKTPPKSLDRNAFQPDFLKDLSTEDGLATLMVLTGQTILDAQAHMPRQPKAWYICGGGRRNGALMDYLKAHRKAVMPIESLGWDGDAIEAQGFAYLAVRSKLGLPLTLPATTGVKEPQTGGVWVKA